MTPERCTQCRGHEWTRLGTVRRERGRVIRTQCHSCGHIVEVAYLELVVCDPSRSLPQPEMSEEDADLVEAIAHLMGSGGASLYEMDVSDASMRELIAQYGQPPTCLRGFVFPAYCWPLPDEVGHSAWLVVIDQGSKRVSFRTRRRGIGVQL